MEFDELATKVDALRVRVEDLIDALTQTPEKRPAPYAKLRETHPNAGKAWRAADDEELRRLFAAGNSVDDLALLFGRTTNGVRLRLERLRLIVPAAAA